MTKPTKFELESVARTINAELKRRANDDRKKKHEAYLKARLADRAFTRLSDVVQKPIEDFEEWPYHARQLAFDLTSLENPSTLSIQSAEDTMHELNARLAFVKTETLDQAASYVLESIAKRIGLNG
jgi:hypothetical protein